MQGRKYYRVVWKDKTFPASWIVADDISDYLKRQFHITRTQTGKTRKQFKKGKRRN